MAEQTLAAPALREVAPGAQPAAPQGRLEKPRSAHRWAIVALGVLIVAAVFVLLAGVRPAYDAYGGLVWGRQAAHLNLDTNAAPSWKPLTFLFTFPYALLAGRGALWLWMVTVAAAAFAAPVLAGRIAYRITAAQGARYAALAAAGLAAVGVVGIEDYWHQTLIATADPVIVALCLGAIDGALCGRPKLAWVLLVAACLGRPEASPLVVAYAAWAWRHVPRLRPGLVVGLVAIPLLWFAVPALTSDSWMIAGDVLGESTSPISGNRLAGVIGRLRDLYGLPMQLAVLGGLCLAVLRRERACVLIGSAAVAWLAVEVGLAWHGWGISPRYMFEPAAALIVLAGAAAGRLLSLAPRQTPALRCGAVGAVLALVVALAPIAQSRSSQLHTAMVLGRTWAKQIQRLALVIAREGGRKRILACGQAVTEVPFQTILAWELGENVIDVGWDPPVWSALGMPIVVFEPHGAGWQVRPVHAFFSPQPARCARLATSTPTN